MQISTLLIYYITTILTFIIFDVIYAKYSNIDFKFNKRTIISVLFASFLSLNNNLFAPQQIRLLTSDIIIFLLYKLSFKDKTKKTIYYTIITCITLQFIDLVLALALPLGIKNIEMLNNSIIFKVGITLADNLFLYLILCNKYVIKFFNDLKDTSNNNRLFYTLGIIGLLICNIWLFYLSKDAANKTLNIILCITELTILILVIMSLKNKYEKNISKIKEEQLKQNLNLYSKVVLEYKELKHNLMNDFLIIKTKLPKKEQDFMNEIINKYKSNYEWVNDVTDIPEGLQGLVFLKKNQAEIKNITFNLEYNVSKNIEKLFEINKNFKLYETLGILFDNAIEGAEESKEKMINVVFTYNKNTLQISILNTFSNDVDLEKIGNKNYSTKKRGSGIGLNYIKKQKNKFKINQSIQGNIFITDIIINHKEKK